MWVGGLTFVMSSLRVVFASPLFVCLFFFLCVFDSLLGMRVANIYDIDNKAYLIRLGK